MWCLLPTASAALLVAVTDVLCQDMAVMPFLWVLPLSLYLLSFIVCFGGPIGYQRGVWLGALGLSLPVCCYALFGFETLPWPLEVAIYAAVFFAACMVCHGELYGLRPAASRLTQFYLMVAAGGALGGALVAVGAPLLFHDRMELQLGFVLLGGLVAELFRRQRLSFRMGARQVPSWLLAVLATAVFAGAFAAQYRFSRQTVVASFRNFYGVQRIEELHPDNPPAHVRVLRSGGTLHGMQFTHPAKSSRPTTYYGGQSAVGQALLLLPAGTGRRIGLAGLGVGTLAAYGQPGDTMRFYEINPQVIMLAQSRFTFLQNSRARIEIVPGDARLTLERESPQGFQLLVLDAFSSDAIPTHLLTREAFEVYRRHLAPDGVLAVHVSNRHLDLRPVVEGLAAHFGWPSSYSHFTADAMREDVFDSDWLLLTHNPEFLRHGVFNFNQPDHPTLAEIADLWTDDFVSLFRVLRGLEPGLRPLPKL
jgi:SAM-dependent methyltransferase